MCQVSAVVCHDFSSLGSSVWYLQSSSFSAWNTHIGLLKIDLNAQLFPQSESSMSYPTLLSSILLYFSLFFSLVAFWLVFVFACLCSVVYSLRAYNCFVKTGFSAMQIPRLLCSLGLREVSWVIPLSVAWAPGVEIKTWIITMPGACLKRYCNEVCAVHMCVCDHVNRVFKLCMMVVPNRLVH